MKANKLYGLLGSCLVVLIFVTAAPALTNYDTFNGTAINYSKWDNQEFVREIRNGKLFSRVRAYSSTQNNYLYVDNPTGIYSLKATVTLLNATAPHDATHTTTASAGLAGVFYNDGTPGSGSIGDVMAQVRLEASDGLLRARYYLIRYTAADGSTWVLLDSGTLIPSITLNQAYILSVKFDPVLKKFTFTAGLATAETLRTGDTINAPKSDWKFLRTFVQAPGGFLGNISAYFASAETRNAANVIVMSDALSAAPISSSNWKTNFEQVRELENSHLHLKLRRVDLTENNSNSLTFSLSEMINELQARVSLIACQKSDPGFSLRARVGGYFFNADGDPASGALGEIFSSVFLGVEEGQDTPKAMFKVSRMTNAEGTTYDEIHSEELLPSITLGAAYTLSIQWDGNQFTAACSDGQGPPVTKTYQPVSGIYPSNIKTKLIDVRLYPPSTAAINDSTIEATFDDVMTDIINLYLPLIIK